MPTLTQDEKDYYQKVHDALHKDLQSEQQKKLKAQKNTRDLDNNRHKLYYFEHASYSQMSLEISIERVERINQMLLLTQKLCAGTYSDADKNTLDELLQYSALEHTDKLKKGIKPHVS